MSAVVYEEPTSLDDFKAKREDFSCVLLGDQAVGKSSLWWTYLNSEFPDSEQLQLLNNEKENSQETQVGDVTYNIIFSQDEPITENTNLRHRIQKLQKAKIFIIMYSIVDCRSFQNIKTKWVDELKRIDEDMPIVVVGNKIDLREEADQIPGLAPISTEEGQQMVEELGLNGFLEISSKQQEGLRDLLRVIVDGVLDGRNKKFEKEKLRKPTSCLVM